MYDISPLEVQSSVFERVWGGWVVHPCLGVEFLHQFLANYLIDLSWESPT